MKCPFCNSKDVKVIDDLTKGRLTVTIYRCRACKTYFSTQRRILKKELSFYEFEDEQPIPQRIIKLFPKSFNRYCKAQQASEDELDELAGVGLRMALETLIWEYLVYIGKIKPTKDAPKLYEMIQMLGDVHMYVPLCAQIIKTYGNKVVHVSKDLPPISLKEAFELYEILCQTIEAELRIIEIANRNSKQNQAKA